MRAQVAEELVEYGISADDIVSTGYQPGSVVWHFKLPFSADAIDRDDSGSVDRHELQVSTPHRPAAADFVLRRCSGARLQLQRFGLAAADRRGRLRRCGRPRADGRECGSARIAAKARAGAGRARP